MHMFQVFLQLHGLAVFFLMTSSAHEIAKTELTYSGRVVSGRMYCNVNAFACTCQGRINLAASLSTHVASVLHHAIIEHLRVMHCAIRWGATAAPTYKGAALMA